MSSNFPAVKGVTNYQEEHCPHAVAYRYTFGWGIIIVIIHSHGTGDITIGERGRHIGCNQVAFHIFTRGNQVHGAGWFSNPHRHYCQRLIIHRIVVCRFF